MTTEEILSLRLRFQNLTEPAKSIADVFASLGAIQAQDRNQAKFSVASRLLNCRERDINLAIAKRKIIRTWLLRGTLHLVAAKDTHWILDLISERTLSKLATYHKAQGLDAKILSRTEAIIQKQLSGKKELTRAELFSHIEEAKIPTKGIRGSFILYNAALKQILCLGKDQGKQETYTLLSDWVEKPKPISREKALGELAKRYFTSRGPASLEDFIWWSGLTSTEAKLGLELAKPHLRNEIVSDQKYWMSGKENEISKNRETDEFKFLAGFDEYIIGYTDRSLFLDPKYSKLVIQKNAIFKPTILKAGKVVGTWNKTEIKKGLEINVSPLFKWKTPDMDGLDRLKANIVYYWSKEKETITANNP
ncbi:winged helix DNA-binding domain-containing protein [Leptospira sp. 'Mane']|uniref:winged helix DNA-binding domain-containing protein n=1 Tax=Leptospira sp. 'Mane' TaxID=3387407 RepID=UPI00398A5B16